MRGQMTHLDTDVLAEFRAGLITGRRGARIAAHLAGCERCTALDARLAGVSALLASVPAPPLPDGLVERLDTVLAAEVADRDDPERSRREPARQPAAAPKRARDRGFRLPSLRVLAPAAAAVLAAGGFGLSQIIQGPASQMTASASSQGNAAAKSVAGANPAAGRGAAPLASPSGTPSSVAAGGTDLLPSPRFLIVTSGTNFGKATLARQVTAELRVQPAPDKEHVAPAQLRACVQLVAGQAVVVRMIAAHYQGAPATVIVTRASHGDKVWVVGPGCSGTHRDLLAQTSLP